MDNLWIQLIYPRVMTVTVRELENGPVESSWMFSHEKNVDLSSPLCGKVYRRVTLINQAKIFSSWQHFPIHQTNGVSFP